MSSIVKKRMCQDQSNFEDDSQIFSVLAALNDMRMIGQFCDITLETGQTKIRAHKIVLAASSSYFKAMFNNDMLEKNLSNVHIQEVDPNALELLVDFIYTGKLTLTENNAFQLLFASDLLQLIKAKELCSKFLQDGLSFTNCFGIKTFADLHNCQELKSSCQKYAANNFQNISKTEEFLRISHQDLVSLISDDSLKIADEQIVYEATMRWIKHDPESRKSHLFTLLSHVKLPLIERNFLITKILREPLVKQDNQAKDLVVEAMEYHLLFENRHHNLSKTQHRKPDGLTEFIFAISGEASNEFKNQCEFFAPADKTWVEFMPTNEKRGGLGVASTNRHIFAIGGRNYEETLSSVEVFDPCNNLWKNVTPMGAQRSYHGVCQLNDIIYAVGGYDGTNLLNSVEIFDPLISTWFSGPSLTTKRVGMQLLALNGSLYVLGGFNGERYLSLVERYDPREGKWSLVSPILTKRSFLGAAVLREKLYVVGGHNENSLKNAEQFEPRSNAWTNICPMLSSRQGHCLVAIEGLLYALGGQSYPALIKQPSCDDIFRPRMSKLSKCHCRHSPPPPLLDQKPQFSTQSIGSGNSYVEYYVPETDEWFTGIQMLTPRSYFGSIVTDCCDLRLSHLDCETEDSRS